MNLSIDDWAIFQEGILGSPTAVGDPNVSVSTASATWWNFFLMDLRFCPASRPNEQMKTYGVKNSAQTPF